MSFLALLLTLTFEQWRPFVEQRAVFASVTAYARFIERRLRFGAEQQSTVAWFTSVVPIVLASWMIYAALYKLSAFLAFAFSVAVLYVTMGFRQRYQYFLQIREALKKGELDTGRALLAEWRGHPCDALSPTEVMRLAIEGALTVAHRHVFAVMFWFLLLPGPSGAVLYRMALWLRQRWSEGDRAGSPDSVQEPQVDLDGEAMNAGRPGRFSEFAKRACDVLEWLPVRFTAASFAIVGNFEDAAYCWRTQAARWPDPLLGIVLAAGAGALGVRLGSPIAHSGILEDRPDLGLGEEADTPFLDSTTGLIWRALVLWLGLLLLLSIAAVFG
jgi:adenosylcobinamide-phosphate synthase